MSAIYLDHNATTPLDPRVLEAMLPFLKGSFGNPASRQHAYGAEAAAAVERAREQVAARIGADPREIVWTSGATESDNLAIFGTTGRPGARIVTCATEHRAVIDPCETLGAAVTWLRPDREGRIDLERLAAAITPGTTLVSLMHANNETGTLHPIREIGRLCKERGALFHTDATQSFGKEPIDVNADGIDLLSASAHKLHGPKGCGLLYVRRKDPRVRLEAQLLGGGHERGFRSGTLNVPAIVGFGEAARIADPAERERVRALRDRLEAALLERIPGAALNGDRERRLANTTNLSFPGAEGEALLKTLPGVAASSASACTSAAMQPSYVLGAMGLDEARIRGSLRFSLGRFTTASEIDAAAARIVDAWRRVSTSR
jgi:cysteine desulfurase